MKVLIIDDDGPLRAELAAFLGLNGHETAQAPDLGGGRAEFARGGVDAVLVDLFLGAETGMAFLEEARSDSEGAGSVPVIMISGRGGVAEAVAAVRAGAYDFLEKPVDPDRLLALLRNIGQGLSLERRLEAMRTSWLEEHAAFAPGSAFGKAAELAREAAASPLSVLLGGPSGSGKEILAQWIHRCSPRAAGPFVAVNCAAVSPELAEAAFFGVRRGAYTGAEADRPGWFQAATTGTLFLDEVGEIPLPVQAKLLRAVESGEVQRVGSVAAERVDLRIVSATSRDLPVEVEAGRFRADLYWRLAQVVIRVPSLAERREDIGLLAEFFLSRLEGGAFAAVPRLSSDALSRLEAREWPGNVRELRAFVERAAWLSRGGEIRAEEVARLESSGPSPEAHRGRAAPAMRQESASKAGLKEAKLDFERDYIEKALEDCEGSVSKAAALLGLLPNNLSRRLRELGMTAQRAPRRADGEDA